MLKIKNKKEDRAYVLLQQHLDKQIMGFPATASGVELRILKHIFTPHEAELAACLSHKPEPISVIYSRAGHLAASSVELEKQLDAIQKKGGIETKVKNGQKHYCNAPLVVGMYELQVDRLTPEFLEDFNEYSRSKALGIEFLGTKLPQMRTIPIGKSILPRHNVSTFDEVTSLLHTAEGPFVILECICRKKKAMEGEPCKITDRQETCLAIGGIAQTVLLSGYGREITRAEATSILDENQKQGLVIQPSNSEKAEFICSCCGCCCGMLDLHQKLPKPLDFWASNFQAIIDEAACNGCGICAKRCQVNAVSVSPENRIAAVDINRCIGCGICVPSCPAEAVSLVKKQDPVRPPRTREDLNDIILENRKGKQDKLKLFGKLIYDTVRTGHTGLLK